MAFLSEVIWVIFNRDLKCKELRKFDVDVDLVVLNLHCNDILLISGRQDPPQWLVAPETRCSEVADRTN